MGEDNSNSAIAPDTAQISDRQILAEKLEEIENLPDSDRKELIAQAFIACATSAPAGDEKYIPLFERKGLRDSQALRELVTDIGANYTDMLLMQRANQLYLPEETGIHEDPDLELKEQAIAKEMVFFTENARERLCAFPAEIKQYAPSQSQNITDAVDKLIGSIINLSLKRVVPALTGFKANSTVDTEDMNVPNIREGQWIVKAYYQYLDEYNKKNAVATETITGRK